MTASRPAAPAPSAGTAPSAAREAPGRPAGAMPLTGAQEGVWYGQRLDPASPAYNTAEYVEIHGPVDPALFERSLRLAIGEIDALNVRFGQEQGAGDDAGGGAGSAADRDRPYQVVEPTDWPLHRLDVAGAPDPRAAAEEWMRADLARPVRPEAGPLFTQALITAGPGRAFWYQRCHHIVLDAYGFSQVARRTAEVYTALAGAPGEGAGAGPFLPLRALVDEEVAYRASERFAADRAYWGTCSPTSPRWSASRTASPCPRRPSCAVRRASRRPGPPRSPRRPGRPGPRP
ncbi:condensation domain-containing protein [Actinomadura yumaensis]|uniref:condensation domain-containing protein n=1 Tax=Actinomadura yumaensis TaxID=111807 RepID=UPI0036211326